MNIQEQLFEVKKALYFERISSLKDQIDEEIRAWGIYEKNLKVLKNMKTRRFLNIFSPEERMFINTTIKLIPRKMRNLLAIKRGIEFKTYEFENAEQFIGMLGRRIKEVKEELKAVNMFKESPEFKNSFSTEIIKSMNNLIVSLSAELMGCCVAKQFIESGIFDCKQLIEMVNEEKKEREQISSEIERLILKSSLFLRMCQRVKKFIFSGAFT